MSDIKLLVLLVPNSLVVAFCSLSDLKRVYDIEPSEEDDHKEGEFRPLQSRISQQAASSIEVARAGA